MTPKQIRKYIEVENGSLEIEVDKEYAGIIWRSNLDKHICESITKEKENYRKSVTNHYYEEGYIKQLPMDPYSDKPLIYKLTDKGFILYSIGRDFKDDGGKYNEFESWEETQKGGDYILYPVFPKENQTPLNTEINDYFTDPNYNDNW